MTQKPKIEINERQKIVIDGYVVGRLEEWEGGVTLEISCTWLKEAGVDQLAIHKGEFCSNDITIIECPKYKGGE